MATDQTTKWTPGRLVRARVRDWGVLPPEESDEVRLSPIDGSGDEAIGVRLSFEPGPCAPHLCKQREKEPPTTCDNNLRVKTRNRAYV